MRRRDFLASVAAAAAAPVLSRADHCAATPEGAKCCAGRTFASPKEAMLAPPEALLYVPGIYTGTKVNKPDYLATVDVDPKSSTYGKVVHRLEMPEVGDELHHFGWNACSSCHGDPTRSRRFAVVPGLHSSRIHIIDTLDPRRPKLHKVIAAEEIARKTDLSAPHTVHCRADGRVMISMLGNARGEGPGGFLLLNDEFEILGRWEKAGGDMEFNYDFWYQPRHNVMVSSEWSSPNTIRTGFKLEDVKAGKYGRHLNLWDWSQRTIAQRFDLGESGLLPLEVRFHHDPDSTHGFVGAALSSAIWHWRRTPDGWKAEKIVQVTPADAPGWPGGAPGMITDLVLSMDDRWLYFSDWVHGDVRQYDVRDPSRPRMAGQLWLGGVLGKACEVHGRRLAGGPQMLQLSLDGKRLYVTNSLYSVWDNQVYPQIAEQGSYLVQIDCDTREGGLKLNERFFVDFGQEPHGPARAHEMRFPNGDCTSDIWV